MRIWFSGPRILGGLVRPGISLGKEDFRKVPAMAANAVLGLFRRSDGAILMALGDKSGSSFQNGDIDTMTDLTPIAAFMLASVPAAIEVREGARVRLAKHIGSDGLVSGLSVGQVAAAIKAEMSALDIDGKFVRVNIEEASEPGANMASIPGAALPTGTPIPAAAAGPTLPSRPPWGIGNIAGWIFAGTFYYFLIMVFAVLAADPKTEFRWYYYAAMMAVAFTMSYFTARPKRIG